MTDEQIADERAIEAHLRDIAKADDIERIRAALDLQPTDEEEARAVFGERLDAENMPIVGVDVDPVIGPMLVRYCAERGLIVIRAARIPRAAYVRNPTVEVMQADYADTKRVFTRCLEQPEYAKRHGWGAYPSSLAVGPF